jgi:hypothetical protein
MAGKTWQKRLVRLFFFLGRAAAAAVAFFPPITYITYNNWMNKSYRAEQNPVERKKNKSSHKGIQKPQHWKEKEKAKQ